MCRSRQCLLLLFCRPAHHESCSYHSFLNLVERYSALGLAYQNRCSLSAHLFSVLFDRGEHRVAGNGTLSVGESAHRDVLRDAQSHVLCRVHYADGRVVVDGEEGVGPVLHVEHLGRNPFGMFSVVAESFHAAVGVYAVLAQRIVPSVVSVLRYLEVHARAVVGYMPASGLDEIFHGRERSHVVVHHHAARVHARADAVEEHKRHVLVYQVGKVVVL